MKNLEIVKYPLFENDDCLIKITDFKLSKEQIKSLSIDPYLDLKIRKFETQDVSKQGFDSFKTKGSLSNISSLKDLSGSVYTYTVGERNFPYSYEKCIETVKQAFDNSSSRRIVLRFLNSWPEYLLSDSHHSNVTCLAMIHYLNFKNKEVRLVFRACDIKEELFYDLITIYLFFIYPIVTSSINISVYMSSAQNIESIDLVCTRIEKSVE